MFIAIVIGAIIFCLGFMTGFLVHKYEYREMSDKEYFERLDKLS